MKTEKEARKLGIEELERRAAPMAIVDVDQQEPEPTGGDTSEPVGGGDDGGGLAPDQPGNSDGHRAKIWQKIQ